MSNDFFEHTAIDIARAAGGMLDDARLDIAELVAWVQRHPDTPGVGYLEQRIGVVSACVEQSAAEFRRAVAVATRDLAASERRRAEGVA